MQRRQAIAHLAAVVLASGMSGASAQEPAPSEAGVRDAVKDFYAAWNRHDMSAVMAFMTEDVRWVFPETAGSAKKSRDAVATFAAYFVQTVEVDYEIVQVKLDKVDARATVLLRGRVMELPKREGRYTRVWERDALVSRWRRENGQWRLYDMVEHVPEARDIAAREGLL